MKVLLLKTIDLFLKGKWKDNPNTTYKMSYTKSWKVIIDIAIDISILEKRSIFVNCDFVDCLKTALLCIPDSITYRKRKEGKLSLEEKV